MAIYLVTGSPGSGKTYWAVFHILKKYFSFDRVLREWLPKFDVTIYSNIDDLRLPHVSLVEALKSTGGKDLDAQLPLFFNVDNQRRLLEKSHRILYFIDEAQSFFNTKFSDNGVLLFFEYHRHLGIDIYLLCPDSSNLARRLRTLAEYELESSSRSKRFLNEFRYHKMIGGFKGGNIVLKHDAEVFRLYRSMTKSETEKVSRVATKYLVALGLLVVFVPLCFYVLVRWFFFRGSASVAGAGKAPVSASAPAVLPSVPLKPLSAGASAEALAADPAKFFSRYQALRFVQKDNGEHLCYGENGYLYTPEVLVLLKSSLVILGNKIYAPKMESEASHRAGAEMATLPTPSLGVAPAKSPLVEKSGGTSHVLENKAPHRVGGVSTLVNEKK